MAIDLITQDVIPGCILFSSYWYVTTILRWISSSPDHHLNQGSRNDVATPFHHVAKVSLDVPGLLPGCLFHRPASRKATFNPTTLSRNLIQESLDVGDEVAKTASSKLVGTRKSRLAEYRKLEQQLAAQLAELDAMKNDSGLKVEMEFETKLRGLLGEYGYSLRDVISLLDPAAAHRSNSEPSASPKKGTRKAPELKVYKNPHSGEIVETKGGNHRLLRAWKN